jgi:hypothetical protein
MKNRRISGGGYGSRGRPSPGDPQASRLRPSDRATEGLNRFIQQLQWSDALAVGLRNAGVTPAAHIVPSLGLECFAVPCPVLGVALSTRHSVTNGVTNEVTNG